MTFFESLKIFLIKTALVLMMSAKLAIPDFLKRKVFQNKGYDVITLDYHITKKMLSCDSNCIVDVAMWPKFGNSIIYVREAIITSTL